MYLLSLRNGKSQERRRNEGLGIAWEVENICRVSATWRSWRPSLLVRQGHTIVDFVQAGLLRYRLLWWQTVVQLQAWMVLTMSLICLAALSICLSQSSDSCSERLDSRLERLPIVSSEISDPTPFVILSNQLIELGPARTRALLEEYCLHAKHMPVPFESWPAYATDGWYRLLLILPLLFDWSCPSELVAVSRQAVPGNMPVSRYSQGLVWFGRLYARHGPSPLTLREGLSELNWSKFRSKPISIAMPLSRTRASLLAKEAGIDKYERAIQTILEQSKAVHDGLRRHRRAGIEIAVCPRTLHRSEL